MSLPELLDELRRAGIRLRVEQGRLRFSAPKGALTEALRARIADQRSALIALLDAEPAPAGSVGGEGEAATAPLSHAQQRLWVVEQLGDLGAAYNIPGAVEIRGSLDVEALARALASVMQRQPSLRTALRLVDDEPRQVVLPDCAPPLEIETLVAPEDAEEAVRARLAAFAERPFDLDTAPLFRVLLLRLDARRHVLGLVLHHAIADGWSISLLLRELGEAYGNPDPGAARPPWPDYAELARRERGPEGQARIERQLAYWRERLGGAPELLDLPADRPRPALQSFRGASATAVLPAETVARLGAVARGEGASLFMALAAVFAALVARYSGEEDFLVGTPLAGRDRPESQGLIGLFVNTLPLRCDLSGDPDFRSLLGRLRRTVLEAFDNPDVPFERLVEAMRPARDPRYPPLCQVLFALQSALDERLELAGAQLSPLRLETRSSKVDLFLSAELRPDGALGLEAEYCSDLFDAARIERLLAHFVRLAAAAAASPGIPVSDLPLLDAAEQALLAGRNPPPTPLAEPQTLPARFAAVADSRPEAVAVVFGDRRLTYGELERAAGRLAGALTLAGVAPGDVVALHLPRGMALPVALLGILWAGAAYLPLETDLPAARRRALLDDARARVLVGETALADDLAEPGVTVVAVEAAFGPEPCVPPVPPAEPDALAYVMYTSGSTGGPKGVCVSHRSVLRLVEGMGYDGPPPQRTLLMSSVAFDASTLELWVPLLSGGTLVVAPPGPLEPAVLAATIRDQAIDQLWLTAGLFHRMAETIPDVLAGVRYLLAGGDVVQSAAAQAVLDRMPALGFQDHRLGNGYGPTECTTFVSLHWMRPGERLGGSVPIGRPIGNTQAYVVDARGRLAPDGVPGELWVGGLGVAHGYLGRPALTAERFLPDGFAGAGRLYRTGDRVRWRADGTLEFLGRLDQQVKLRGFRVEPGEIEQALLALDGVAQAAVVPQVAGSGATRLVAYLVGAEAAAVPSADALRAALAERLPSYMVPAAFVFLDAMPLNRSGKVDRRALPAPEVGMSEAVGSRPPRGPLEERLAGILCGLLKREEIGAEDNFFALGGDSILAMQAVLRAGQAGLSFGLRDLLEQQTVAGLAAVAGRAAAAPRPQAPEPVAGPLPLSPIQRWFFARRLAKPSHWNQAVLLATSMPLSLERLQAGLDSLAARHEALRLHFPGEGAERRALVGEPATVPLQLLSPADDAEQSALADAIQAALDLEKGPLFRAALFRRADGGQQLLLVAHHLVVDVVSWGIMIEELAGSLDEAAAPPAGPAPVPWSVYAARVPATPRPSAAPARPLPVDDPDGANEEATAAVLSCNLDEDLTETFLGAANAALRSEPTELLLAAFAGALLEWSGGGALTLDVERHGRDVLPALDLSRSVGWFTRLDPRRVERPRCEDPGGWLANARLAERPAGPGGERAEVSLNYLGRLGEAAPGPLRPVDGPSGAFYGAGAERLHLLELIAVVTEGRLRLDLRYSPARHREATAARLLERIADRLRALLGWALDPARGSLLPQDVPLAGLDRGRLERLLARLGPRQGRHPARDVETILPLSPQQQGMLFDSLAGAGSGIHHEQLVIRLKGALDPAALRAAWRQATARHAILRTAFVWDGLPQPLQVVFRQRAPSWSEREGAPDAGWLREDRLATLDLERAEAFRLTLWRAGAEDWRLVWTFHHLLLDGWSMALLLREVMTLYAAERRGRSEPLPAAPAYGAYVAWLAERDQSESLGFWRRALADLPALPSLAFPGAERPQDGDPYGERRLDLDAGQGAALEAAAQRRAVTLGTLVQAAWILLLGGLLRAEEVVVGITTAGRPDALPGSDAAAGLFIGSLPLRARLPVNEGLEPWLADLFARHLGVLAHQHVGTAALGRAAGVPAERPLFEALLVYENYPSDLASPSAADGESAGLKVVEVASCGARTRYPLTLLVIPGERLRLQLVFDRRRIPDRLADRLLVLLDRLLGALGGDAPSVEELVALVASADLPVPCPPEATEIRHDLAEAEDAPATDRERLLAEIWCGLLGRPSVPLDRSFFELGGHSLLALEMAAAVERRLGLAVDAALLFRAPTVRKLAAALARLDLEPAAALLPLGAGEGAPLVVLPGASGNPLAYLPLARRLGGRPVFGVQLAGLLAAGSLEAMAGRLAADLLAAELPPGPVHLLGHSFGAALAYETARRLAVGGRPLGAVMLLDLEAPGTREPAAVPDSEPALLSEIARAAARYFDRPLRLPPGGLCGPDCRRAFLAALAEAGLVSERADDAVVQRLLGLYRQSLEALAGWSPQPFAGPLTVLRATESDVTAGEAADPTLGWSRWARSARGLALPGDHIGVILEPAVARLAEVVAGELAEAERRLESVPTCA